MNPTRRSFLLGLSTVLAAPAIVRASSLMPVKAPAESASAALLRSGGLEIDFTTNIVRSIEYVQRRVSDAELMDMTGGLLHRRVIGTVEDVLSLPPGARIEPGKGLLVESGKTNLLL